MLGTGCSRLDEAGTPEAEAKLSELNDAVDESGWALVDASTTTMGGVVALLRYVAEIEHGKHESLPVDDITHQPWSYFMHSNLANALFERLTASA